MLISDGALAPVALADSSPSIAYSSYLPPSGLALADAFATYGEIYKRQLWVAVLVNKVATAASRLPFKVYRRTPHGRDDASDSPLGRLMAAPNERHDPVFFWLWTVSTFEIYGEALWLKARGASGLPVQLLPLHPANITTRRLTAEDQAAGKGPAGSLLYTFRLSSAMGTLLEFPEADVVHFRSYNPDNLVRGLSRLEPLRQTLVNEDAARRATSSFWQRGARPGFALSHPAVLSQPAADRIKHQFDAITAGADRTGATVVLEEGMNPVKLDLSAEEAQYIETRKLNREEACAIFDVPPPVVHILDRATFSNITEQMRSMYRDTMAPRLGTYESTLRAQLYPEFEPDVYGEFLMDEVMRGSFEARMAAYKDSIGFGIQTPGEVRELENLPDLGEDTHRLYINSTMIPLGSAAGANATGSEVVVHPQPTKALTAETLRTVMGRIPNTKALAELDPARLVAGLNGESASILEALDAAVMAGESAPEFRERVKALAGKDTP